MGEIVALTSLRGVLALWIVLFHYWDSTLILFPSVAFLSPLMRVGHLAVPAFFILSGFVLAYNYGNRFHHLRGAEVFRFLCLRLARIYPVHLFTLLVVAAMVWTSARLGYHLTDAGYSARDFILNLFLMHTWVPDFKLNWNYPSWSISSEWFAYLLFPLMVAIVLRYLTTRARAAFAVGAGLIGGIGIMLWWQTLPFYTLLLVMPTFFAGAAVYWLIGGWLGVGDSGAWRRWLPEALTLAVIAACFTSRYWCAVTAVQCCVVAFIAVTARLGTNCHRVWTAAPIAFLGEVSYSLYMTHTIAQKLLVKLLPAMHFESAALPVRLSVIAAYILVVAVWCLGTYFLLERPSRRFFKKMTLRRKRPEAAPYQFFQHLFCYMTPRRRSVRAFKSESLH